MEKKTERDKDQSGLEMRELAQILLRDTAEHTAELTDAMMKNTTSKRQATAKHIHSTYTQIDQMKDEKHDIIQEYDHCRKKKSLYDMKVEIVYVSPCLSLLPFSF